MNTPARGGGDRPALRSPAILMATPVPRWATTNNENVPSPGNHFHRNSLHSEGNASSGQTNSTGSNDRLLSGWIGEHNAERSARGDRQRVQTPFRRRPFSLCTAGAFFVPSQSGFRGCFVRFALGGELNPWRLV